MTDERNRLDEIVRLTNIDKLIHEPARFILMSYLYVVAHADFVFLMRETGLTRGNLSSHMSKLEDAGYINIEKKFVGKKPLTLLQITDSGRVAYDTYRKAMKTALDSLP